MGFSEFHRLKGARAFGISIENAGRSHGPRKGKRIRVVWCGLRILRMQYSWKFVRDLIVGADGRRSLIRDRAGLQVMNLGAPIDVIWMRLSRQPNDPGQTFGHIESGKMLRNAES